MDKININRVAISHSKYGIETVPEWNGLEAFNNHVAAISKQKDWQMYFPMEAVIKFKNPDGTPQCLELIRIGRPYEITL
jgi:hypothetical protein